jgi:hypothetical protein
MIKQIMTCFSVPGGFLLSPLPGNILQLTKKVVPSSKKWESNVVRENAQETNEGPMAKKMKADWKKKKLIDTKISKNRNDISAVMKKEIDIETTAGQKIVSEALNIPLLSESRTTEAKGDSHFEEEATVNTLSRNKDARLKERVIKSDSMTVKAESVKAGATECIGNSDLGISEMDAPKGELKPRTEKTERTLEERNATNDKSLVLDRKQERRIKSDSKCYAPGINYEADNAINERTAVSQSIGKVAGKEISLHDTNGENKSKSEAKRVQREQKTSASTSSDFLEDDKNIPSAAVQERKGDMQSKSSHTGKKPKVKSHRDGRDNLPEGSGGGKEQEILESGSGFGDPRPKEKSWKNESDGDVDPAAVRETSSSVRHDRHTVSEEHKLHIPPHPNANAAPALPAPVIIEEKWVCCDKCEKWRLLPYEMNPSNLPKKWKCSMQLWL